MRAMVFTGKSPELELQEVARPVPGPGQVLIRVEACGVCRTDLHVVDGDLTEPKLPLIPGHGVGPVADQTGTQERRQRYRVSPFRQRKNKTRICHAILRIAAVQRVAGKPRRIAEVLASLAAVIASPAGVTEPGDANTLLHGQPLATCAQNGNAADDFMAGERRRLGIYGFGAAAHILCQIAVHQGREVYAFTREGDSAAQEFARRLGAVWAGASPDLPPQKLDAAIIFAPVGALVPQALSALRKGGRVVCGGIHMSDIPSFPYADLWQERSIVSVANLTRADGEAFFPLVAKAGVQTETAAYPLENANTALQDLRRGALQGAAVLVP